MCWDAAVTETVGDMSMQDAGMLTGVSDGLEDLQQHSVGGRDWVRVWFGFYDLGTYRNFPSGVVIYYYICLKEMAIIRVWGDF